MRTFDLPAGGGAARRSRRRRRPHAPRLVGPGTNSGLGMVEILVSVVVLGIVIVPIFNSLVSGRIMAAHRGEKRMALRLVERKVEQLMQAGYGSGGSDANVQSVNLDLGTHPTDPSIVVNTRGDNDGTNDVLGNLTWFVVPSVWPSPGDSVYAKEVAVKLVWPQASPRDSVSVTTLIGG